MASLCLSEQVQRVNSRERSIVPALVKPRALLGFETTLV